MKQLDLPKVQFSNGSDHLKTEQNGSHLVFGPLENRTSKKIWYSNVFGIPMFGIQAPTVLTHLWLDIRIIIIFKRFKKTF